MWVNGPFNPKSLRYNPNPNPKVMDVGKPNPNPRSWIGNSGDSRFLGIYNPNPNPRFLRYITLTLTLFLGSMDNPKP